MNPRTGEINDHSGLPLVAAASLFALLTAAIAVTAGWRWFRSEFKKLLTELDRTDGEAEDGILARGGGM
ncbi:hypothetical protein ACFC1R_20435 [Kitasatospora sp. NPDC056138]|uniref:hypothetical protein n=1 Tax=Kitasatospora sp. NPDC056138 TaxID=3345724 RepID=UPI0035D954C6